jgi:hypothetical protein
MASVAGPTYLGRATTYMSERANDASRLMHTSGLIYVIYALCLGIVIATILMIVDNFYPFLPINPISGPSAAARAVTYFWPANAENLIVPKAQSPTILSDNYTMSIQLMIGDSRSPSIGKYRHIVHRGSNPVAISGSGAGPSGHAGIQLADLAPETDPNYALTGLTSIMNPGIFLDKYKNDIHVFVHTKSMEGSMNVLLLESVTIADLPLQTPLTLGITCSGKTFEVYVNCKLYSTLLLKGTPYLPPANNEWFGRYGVFPMSGLIQNLALWPLQLGSSDYMQMCSTGSFNKGDLPEVCTGSAQSVSPSVSDGLLTRK